MRPDSPNIKNNLEKIKQSLRDKNIKIYFYPSEKLVQLIMNGTHPYIAPLLDVYKSIFLSKRGVLIQKRIFLQYLSGELDKRHKFIFDNGEIRLLGTENTIMKYL